MGKPGYKVVLEHNGKRTDTGRVQVVGPRVVVESSRILGHGSTTELLVDRIDEIIESKTTVYRLILRTEVATHVFVMSPKDGKALADEIRGARKT